MKNKNNTDKEMSLSGHLKELRNRLGVCIVLLVITMVIALEKAPTIVSLLLDIGRAYNYEFVYISPQELIIQYFQISLIVGVCVLIPLLGYEIYAFVSPGLKKLERLVFLLAMTFGLICFCIGVYFAYKVMLPFMLFFLIQMSTTVDVTASITVSYYVSFLLTIFVIFGIIFELPVLSLILTQLGIIKVEWMKKARRVVIVLIFIIAAIITPPDIVSQIMVAIPIFILYEFSIIVCTIAAKFRREKVEELAEEE